MKKLAVVAVNTWLLYLFGSLLLMAFIVAPEPVHAAEFSCSSGNVSCLIAKINEANGMPGNHVINLEPGSYVLQMVDNPICDNGNCPGAPNGLPVIIGSIRIRTTAEDLPTVIERAPNAPSFRIFEVAVGGELTLASVTVQRGGGGGLGAPALVNRGVTSLEDAIVRDNLSDNQPRHVTRYQKYNR